MITFVIFTILLILSAFFSSSETAFFSLTPANVHLLKKKHRTQGTLVEKLKAHPQKLLITILIGNNIVNLFTASYATIVATRLLGSAALGIATGATTLFVLIFGEIIPKSFAYAKKKQIALLTAWPLYILSLLLFPIVWLLLQLNTFFAKLTKSEQLNEAVKEEEVRAMTRLSVEHGEIDYREHEMIENVFRFNDILVDDIMTPWYRVTILSGIVPIDEIAHFVAHEGFSRYPVHDGKNDDHIIGYIHINDIMKALNSDRREEPIRHFVKDVCTVSEDTTIERIFRKMLRKKSHLFLVHKKDDPATLIGLVTLEDVIEQIVGEIEDERDRALSSSPARKEKTHTQQ